MNKREPNAAIHPQLLENLRCPQTSAMLAVADDNLVRRLNDAIDAGAILNQGGQTPDRLDGGLIAEDQGIFYPVRDGIPVMLVDEAISINNLV